MEVISTRKQVRICNWIIMALCLVSILAYFILPFWKVSVKLEVTAETVQELLPSSEDGEGSSEEFDVSSLLSEEDMPVIQLSIALKTADILSSMASDPSETVETILDDNVNSIINQLEPVINKLAKSMLKGVAKETLSSQLKEQVKSKLGEEATDEEIQAELDAMNLSEEYIDGKTDELIDHLYSDGATAESTADKTVDIIEESINRMKENPEYQDVTFSEEDKADLKEELVELFSQFESEDGTLNPESFTTDLLLGLLNGEDDGSGEGSSDETLNATQIKPLSAQSDSSDSAEKSEEDAKEELRTLLTEKLMDMLGDATDIIAMVMQYISYFILFTFFTWAYLILKILVKWKRVNNAIKLKLPIWLGSLPYVILCLAPTIALKALASNLPLPSGLSLSFMSAGLVSFIIGIGFIFFALFYYGKRRRFLKRAAKKGYVLEQAAATASEEADEIAAEQDAPQANE